MAQKRSMLAAVCLISVLAMASPVGVESGASTSNSPGRHVTQWRHGTWKTQLDGQSRGVRDDPGFYGIFQARMRKFISMVFDVDKGDERMDASLSQAGRSDGGKDALDYILGPASQGTAAVADETGHHSNHFGPEKHRVRWSIPHKYPGDGFSFKIQGLQRSDSPIGFPIDDPAALRWEQASEKAVIAEDGPDGHSDSPRHETGLSRAARLPVNENDNAMWRGAPLRKTAAHPAEGGGVVQQFPDTAVGDRSIWEMMWTFPSDIGWLSGPFTAGENIRRTSPEHTHLSGNPDEATSAGHGGGVQEVHGLNTETSGGRPGNHMARPVFSWEANRVLWATNQPCSKPLMQDGRGGKFSGAGSPCAGDFKPTIARRYLIDVQTSPSGYSSYYYSTSSPSPATSEYNYEYYLQTPAPTPSATHAPDETFPTPAPTPAVTQPWDIHPLDPSPTPAPDEHFPTPAPTPSVTQPWDIVPPTPSPTNAPDQYGFPTPSPTDAPDEYYFPTPAPTNAPDEYYFPTPAPTNAPDEYYFPTPAPTDAPDEYYFPTTAPTDAPDEYFFPTPAPTNALDEYYFPTPAPTNAPDEYYFLTPSPTNAPDQYGFPTPSPTDAPDEYYFPTPAPTNAPDEHYFPTPAPTDAPDEYYFPTPAPTDAPDEYYFPTPAPTEAPDQYYFPTPAPTEAPDQYYFPTPAPTPSVTQPGKTDPPTPAPTNPAMTASDGASVVFLMPFPNLDIVSFEDARYSALLRWLFALEKCIS